MHKSTSFRKFRILTISCSTKTSLAVGFEYQTGSVPGFSPQEVYCKRHTRSVMSKSADVTEDGFPGDINSLSYCFCVSLTVRFTDRPLDLLFGCEKIAWLFCRCTDKGTPVNLSNTVRMTYAPPSVTRFCNRWQ